jgi:inner membrane protein
MENVAHSLVGLAAAKAGLERWSPGATSACVIAANLPDIDIVAAVGGKWFLLEHHRGITHALVGIAILPVILSLFYFTIDALWGRWMGRARQIRFWPLLCATALACASHLILDWTNNYGVRPFLPWSNTWYYGDLVFIIDPWVWLICGGAVFLVTSKSNMQRALWIIGSSMLTTVFLLILWRSNLHGKESFALIWGAAILAIAALSWLKAGPRFGRVIPLSGLALLVFYWGGLSIVHKRALNQAKNELAGFVKAPTAVENLAVMPTFGDPRTWTCLAQTPETTYRFDIALGRPGFGARELVKFEVPGGAEAREANEAAADENARIFLRFARFPVAAVEGNCLSGMVVRFADLRFTRPGQSSKGSFSIDVPVECAGAD